MNYQSIRIQSKLVFNNLFWGNVWSLFDYKDPRISPRTYEPSLGIMMLFVDSRWCFSASKTRVFSISSINEPSIDSIHNHTVLNWSRNFCFSFKTQLTYNFDASSSMEVSYNSWSISITNFLFHSLESYGHSTISCDVFAISDLVTFDVDKLIFGWYH